MSALKLFKYIEVSYETNPKTGKPEYVVRGMIEGTLAGAEVVRTEDKSVAKIMATWWSAQLLPAQSAAPG